MVIAYSTAKNLLKSANKCETAEQKLNFLQKSSPQNAKKWEGKNVYWCKYDAETFNDISEIFTVKQLGYFFKLFQMAFTYKGHIPYNTSLISSYCQTGEEDTRQQLAKFEEMGIIKTEERETAAGITRKIYRLTVFDKLISLALNDYIQQSFNGFVSMLEKTINKGTIEERTAYDARQDEYFKTQNSDNYSGGDNW